jgi:hypothetical protein
VAIEDFFELACLQERRRAQIGFGGSRMEWVDGETVMVGFILKQSLEAGVAEAQTVRSVYRIVAREGTGLKSDSVLRRLRDGRLYRIMSDFAQTPEAADKRFMYALAEVI